ncbi:enterohemolysin [Salmonella enterica subsp. enterica serovar Typhimurium]|nr:enterohemolysin [Salmonella enterica subsp. enterica serovar Typhimurium]
MSTSIVTTENQTPKIDSVSILTNGELFDRMLTLASVMSKSGNLVPALYHNKPDSCMAIVMQAARWGMDPFAVAQKTFIIGDKGVLGYEAQLVNAVISSSNAITGRFHYEYGGNWEQITGNGENRNEEGLYIRVGAVLRGESAITWGENIYLADIKTKNSPLWKTAPKQQIAYLAVKYWARLYCPEVILGVYTPDELEERDVREEKIINPAQVVTHDIVIENKSDSNIDALADELRKKIDEAETIEEAKQIRSDIESSKSSLGALYNELKSKAVKRYRFVEARNSIEAAFNSLPRPDEPDATACFAAVEKSLEYAKKHLGDDLYSQYLVNLNDIRPEYITA